MIYEIDPFDVHLFCPRTMSIYCFVEKFEHILKDRLSSTSLITYFIYANESDINGLYSMLASVNSPHGGFR